MDISNNNSENRSEPTPEFRQPTPIKPISSGDIFDIDTWKRFFSLTGGSVFYCLSAVFVAYGIVKIMGPILSVSNTLRDALPCILTLHIYEIALLGVLILIVSKKVVDDAISVVILMALFLVGTSIALGSVAEKNITASLFVGFVSVAVAFGKLYSMRYFARIPFGVLSVSGLGVLMACNYFGPIIMVRSISVDPSQEFTRRGLWMFLWLAMLIAAVIVLVEAVRTKYQPAEQKDNAFLQRPVMVYVFALILLVTSSVHQYCMAFTFALERVLGDFVPVAAVVSLLLLEVLRHTGKRFGFSEIVISCISLAAMLLAIKEKAVLTSGHLGFGLIGYPPVFFALAGLSMAAVAICHRWHKLFVIVFFYGLGVILTVGFSPEHPYDLNTHACILALVFASLLYGIITNNQFSYLSGIVVLCIELTRLPSFPVFVKSLNLTEVGSLAGVCGLGCMAFYLFLGRQLHKVFQIVGALCIAGCVYDYLPEYIHWSYIIALFITVCLIVLLWFKRKDILVIVILCVPFLVQLYTMAKRLAYWRIVILGFLLLAVGTVISLFKRSTKNRSV